MPAGLSLAAKSTRTYNLVRRALANDYIKLRKSKDLIGTEVCGSIKNVIAMEELIEDIMDDRWEDRTVLKRQLFNLHGAYTSSLMLFNTFYRSTQR